MDNKNVNERTKNTDREQVDGVQKDQKMPTKSSMGYAHSPVGKGVTQIMRAVTVAPEPVTTLMVGLQAQSYPICVLRTKPKSSFEVKGQPQTIKVPTHTPTWRARGQNSRRGGIVRWRLTIATVVDT